MAPLLFWAMTTSGTFLVLGDPGVLKTTGQVFAVSLLWGSPSWHLFAECSKAHRNTRLAIVTVLTSNPGSRRTHTAGHPHHPSPGPTHLPKLKLPPRTQSPRSLALSAATTILPSVSMHANQDHDEMSPHTLKESHHEK